jgi:hypothetical protein
MGLRTRWIQQVRKILHRSKEARGKYEENFGKRKIDGEARLLDDPHGNEKTKD